MKLDSMSNDCIFMTYSGTDKNAYIVNKDGTNECLSTHITYDEAHISSTNTTIPPMATVLQQAVYTPATKLTNYSSDIIKIQLLHRYAKISSKGTDNSAGYDISTYMPCTISHDLQLLINSKIAIEIPTGCFGQFKSRSGLALKHNVHAKAGKIDAD